MTINYMVEYTLQNNETLYAHFNSKKIAEEYRDDLKKTIKTLKRIAVRQVFDSKSKM